MRHDNARIVFLVTRVLGVATLLPTLLLVAFALWQSQRTRDFLAIAKASTGTIVQVSRQHDTFDTDPTFVPIVAYIDASGQRRYVEGGVGREPGHWRQGASVQVLYDPAQRLRPSVVGSRTDLWFPVIIATSMASVFAIATALVLLLPWFLSRRSLTNSRSG